MHKPFNFDIDSAGQRGIALGTYYPYWLDKAAKVKNPNCNPFSKSIMDFKDEKSSGHVRAVKLFTGYVMEQIFATGIIPAEIVVVPSSTAGKVSAGLSGLAMGLAETDRRLFYRHQSLRRVKSIAKLANGGDRSFGVHLQSLEYQPHGAGNYPVVLIDDVATTTNSLGGAMMVISAAARSGIKFLPLVLGRTGYM